MQAKQEQKGQRGGPQTGGNGLQEVDAMRGSETVLLIDDEEPVLDIGTRFLTNFGYRVITALNGEIAWDLFCKFRDEIDLAQVSHQ